MLWSQPSPATMSEQSFASQQWSISWDGYISSAADPTQYLTQGTYADGTVTTAPPQDGAIPIVTLAAFDAGLLQQWVVLPGGDRTAAIATKQSYDQYLAANGVNPPPVQVLSTWAQQVNDNVWLPPSWVRPSPIPASAAPSNGMSFLRDRGRSVDHDQEPAESGRRGAADLAADEGLRQPETRQLPRHHPHRHPGGRRAACRLRQRVDLGS